MDNVLDYMGKPRNEVYNRFIEKYRRLNQKYGKEQYVVPYLISSHPGSTLAGRGRARGISAQYRKATGAGTGFLPDTRDAIDLHVLFRH